MARLDHLATPDLRIVLAGLDRHTGSEEGSAALDVMRGWSGGDVEAIPDAGDTRLVSFDGGLEIRVREDTIASVSIEAHGNTQSRPFARVDRVLHGLTATMTREEFRAREGLPVLSAYGNETYSVDGDQVILNWETKAGSLRRIIIVRSTPAERTRLRRKARNLDEKAAAAVAAPDAVPVTRVTVSDEDGILGIVDPAVYRSSVTGWDVAALAQRFTQEMNAGRGLFFMTGWPDHRDYVIEFLPEASTRPAVREAEQTVDVTSGVLRVLDYGTLTMAADEDAETLPDEPGGDAAVALPNGRYVLRIRQLVDPEAAEDDDIGADEDSDDATFEVVYAADPAASTSSHVRPLWWATGDDGAVELPGE